MNISNHNSNLFKNLNKNKQREKWIEYVTQLNNSEDVAKLRLDEETISYKYDFIDYRLNDLNKKIEDYCEWYYDTFIKDHKSYDKNIVHQFIMNFVDKMAIWYELRYPNEEVMFLFSKESKLNNRKMIYIKENVSTITWKEILNYQTFYNTLSPEEKELISNPSYEQCYEVKNANNGSIFISPDGIIKTDEIRLNVTRKNSNYGEMLYINTDFYGLNIFQAQKLFKMYGMYDDEKSMMNIINDYQNQIERKERLLDCVMFRIIERGENRIGSRRAYLFAKEFQRNLDIPIMYGLDTSDPHLQDFINTYLNDGGDINLKCLVNYLSYRKEDCNEYVLKYLVEEKEKISLKTFKISK